MTALTNQQREVIKRWLDNDTTYSFEVLNLPEISTTSLGDDSTEYRVPAGRTIRIRRQEVTYRKGFWQYYAEDEYGEPLVFGVMRQGPPPPRPHVKQIADRMRGCEFTPAEGEYLKSTVHTRVRP